MKSVYTYFYNDLFQKQTIYPLSFYCDSVIIDNVLLLFNRSHMYVLTDCNMMLAARSLRRSDLQYSTHKMHKY